MSTEFVDVWKRSNWTFDVLYILPFLLIIIRGFSYYLHGRQTDLPPLYTGWIPWLGCAVEFGKSPLTFIQRAREKLGPIFTLKVVGQRLTFVTEEDDINVFFQSENLDFELAVHKAVNNTADIPAVPFFSNHSKLHSMMKGILAPGKLEPFCKTMSSKFAEHIKKWGKSGSGDLNQLVRRTMYAPVLEGLFGDGILPTDNEKAYRQFEEIFLSFDSDFEHAAEMPPFILRKFRNAKEWLMDKFVNAAVIAESTQSQTETLFQSLIKTVERKYAPNFGLLMMWASLANAIPMTFWTLAFIFSHPKILHQLREEIFKELGSPGKDITELEITLEKLQKLESVKRCLLEAIRLRSPGVISRGVEKSFKIKGDKVMLSPYWVHRNPKYFPEPNSFNPDRWLEADLKRNIFLEGFVAFGGGRYQCPGRWFALMEMQIFLIQIIYKMDIQLLGKVPDNSPMRIVGVQQPETILPVKYEARL